MTQNYRGISFNPLKLKGSSYSYFFIKSFSFSCFNFSSYPTNFEIINAHIRAIAQKTIPTPQTNSIECVESNI